MSERLCVALYFMPRGCQTLAEPSRLAARISSLSGDQVASRTGLWLLEPRMASQVRAFWQGDVSCALEAKATS